MAIVLPMLNIEFSQVVEGANKVISEVNFTLDPNDPKSIIAFSVLGVSFLASVVTSLMDKKLKWYESLIELLKVFIIVGIGMYCSLLIHSYTELYKEHSRLEYVREGEYHDDE